MTAFFNTGMSQQQFLDHYWQKKPLLIRQAFASPLNTLSADELAAFACEQEIESRLIQEHGTTPWQLQYGPFDEHDFAALPETHWTLLVQDMDKHYPPLQDVLKPFDFLADWRRDDLMISFAPEGGSVGPHTDSYDVFLLQAQGSRRWQISDKPVIGAPLRTDTELRILQEFKADQSWDLQPGDMLYLPPDFAHHGVALDDCMTFSIGFRASSQLQLLDAFTHTLTEQLAEQFYADSDVSRLDVASEIDNQAMQRFQQLLLRSINDNIALLPLSVGRLVTETKPTLQGLAEEFLSDKPALAEMDARFERGDYLQRNDYLRFAWHQTAEESYLFAAGEAYKVEPAATKYLPMLTGNRLLKKADWQQLRQYPLLADVCCELIAEGAWYWAD